MINFLILATAPSVISRVYVRDYNGWRLAGAREGSGWIEIEANVRYLEYKVIDASR